MDKHVINASLVPAHAEEQLDWVHSLEPTHINLVPDTVAPITRIGKSRLFENSIAGSAADER
ncbi:hypothetical protein [Cellvibrio sp. UBA7671]|uniref:hypothetical protein n=1 Tax=Cellvibrio sp. UBA7671 TaxID=1946312 RepID=UPI002F35BD39